MKTITPEKLAEILGKHKAWLDDEEGGERANLSGANLRGANLRGANLSEIRELWGASGNGREIKALQCGTYSVTYTDTYMQIGCQIHQISEWWAFKPAEIDRMDGQATAWWSVWRPILQNIIASSPAVPGAVAPEPVIEAA